jgi:hypothetical protein
VGSETNPETKRKLIGAGYRVRPSSDRQEAVKIRLSVMMCEQGRCRHEAVTWCPLCEKLLCAEHDELTPRRMHDCLGSTAADSQPVGEICYVPPAE